MTLFVIDHFVTQKRALRSLSVGLVLATACPAWGAAVSASSPPPIVGRFAAHDDFDRLVLPWPHGARVDVRQDAQTLILALPGGGVVSIPAVAGRRARSFAGGAGRGSVALAPGARVRVSRLGDRVVVDISDGTATPKAAVTPTSAIRGKDGVASPARAKAAHAVPAEKAIPTRIAPPPAAPSVKTAPLEPVTMPAAPPPAPVFAPATPSASPAPVPQPVPPAGVAVSFLSDQSGLGGPAILIPLGRDVGAAAFRRGGNSEAAQGHVVFDVAQPLDLSQVKDDPAFGSLTERLLSDGTHLELRLRADAQLRLARRPDGWALALIQDATQTPPPVPIGAQMAGGRLVFTADAPGRVVVLEDETTGGRLMVGTQRTAGQGMVGAHQSAEFAVLATWQGVVVQPVSDRLLLRGTRTGFELAAADGGALGLLWPDQAAGDARAGRAMTRLFDLPDLPLPALHNRMTQALRDAAASPRLGRFAARLRAAQAMLAQGMDLEAAGALRAAVADDPAHRADPLVNGLAGIAAFLSAQAGGQDPPPPTFDLALLGTTDEAMLWRTLLQPGRPDDAAAATLATVWPLLLDYPPLLRRLILPVVAGDLSDGRHEPALTALLAAFPDPSLDLARAGLLSRQGKTDASLALLDQIAARPPRLPRALAMEQATELRLATHRLLPGAAADQLARQLYAWRNDQRELRLRLRIATLRAQAGAWRDALSVLRETESAFPDARAIVHGAQSRLIAGLLAGDSAARLSPLDLVALADETGPLLAEADTDGKLAPLLVDKLLALDLPDRAEPVLRRLFAQAPAGATRAELGVRLAQLLADSGDEKGALAIMGPADADGLDPALTQRRGLLRARLLADSGQANAALALLAGLPGQAAMDQRVGLLEKAHDWAGAAAALESFRQGAGFAGLDDAAQRALILRLARDDSEAGDIAGLQRLRSESGARFASGQGAALFAVLTEAPVQGVSDLPRAGQELNAMRGLPVALGAKTAPPAH